MRRPWLTTEFWVMIIAVITQTFGWIDFPREAVAAIIVWIFGRAVQKGLAARNGVKA